MKVALNDNRILNCLESRQTENDWAIEVAVNSGVITASDSLPETVDLRESWWAINDQKKTGSCVGWALADSVLRWHFVKNGTLEPDELLSSRFIWMASKETDQILPRPSTFIESSGTTLKAALDVTRHYGCVKDSDLPFLKHTLYQDDEDLFYSLAANFRIRQYFNLNNSGNVLMNWKKWLSKQGPILTRINVDHAFANASDSGGYLNNYSSYHIGGHAIAIVGYDSEHFIIRNSWGEGWGEKGFAYASYDYARQAFKECYGVNTF